MEFLAFEVFGSRKLVSAIGDDRIKTWIKTGQDDSSIGFGFSGILLWRVCAGLKIQNVRLRGFGFKGSELGVQRIGSS